jgi:hypothetical protein
MTTTLISSHKATLWTGPTRRTRMMQLRALAKRCAHGLFRHDTHKGAVVLGVLGNQSPWDRLAALLSNPDLHRWPTDGWILVMEIRCAFCGETRLVEIQQSHKGQIVVCACCGKEGPLVSAAGSRT